MHYFAPFLAAAFIAVFLTGFLRLIGIKKGFVSVPRQRDIHQKPIPRIGGVAIFISFLVVSVVIYIFNKESLSLGLGQWFAVDKRLIAIWLGGMTIALSMLFDDLYSLKAWQKFVFQFIAVLFLIASGIGIDHLPNPFNGSLINLNSVYIPIFKYHGIVYHFSLWSDLLTLVWIVGMMNIINFVDGVDGLAGGVSLISLVTVFILAVRLGMGQSGTALISIILAGAVLGFLFWNFPPAKIFMGDSGSMFLGFMIGTLTLVSGGKLATVFLVLGFPIVDGLFVAGGRILRHQNPFTTPDKTHLHHRFLAAGFKPFQAMMFIYLISIAFAWVALRSSTENKVIASVILVVLLAALIWILKFIAARRNHR